MTCRNPDEERIVVDQTKAELSMMGMIGSYGNSIQFIGNVQDRFRPIEHSPELPLVPLTKIKTCFVRVDKKVLKELTSAHRDCLGGMRDPLCINEILSRSLENEESSGVRS